jgi:hypothetical protein
MGPEITGSGMLMTDSYIIEMFGIYHEGGVTDDNDGIYMHRQGAGQELRISNSVVAHVDDDAVDTLGASIILEHSIVRNADNPDTGAKGLSMIGGQNTLRYNLFVDNSTGINLKGQASDNLSGTTAIDHLTLVGSAEGIVVEDKFGIPNADLHFIVSNSIIRATDAVLTDYDPADITITYSNVSEAWPGVGNINVDPQFVNAAAKDFHLATGSPAIDSGDPAAPLDLDGTRTDMGALPTFQTGLFGDFDGNGLIDAADIDALCAATQQAEPEMRFDLTGDSLVSSDDVDYLVENILGTNYGDANLDGEVDGTDWGIIQANLFQAGGWAEGNFNCVGGVDVRDFNIWLANRFSGAPAAAASIGGTPRAAAHVTVRAVPSLSQFAPPSTTVERQRTVPTLVAGEATEETRELSFENVALPRRAFQASVARRHAQARGTRSPQVDLDSGTTALDNVFADLGGTPSTHGVAH